MQIQVTTFQKHIAEYRRTMDALNRMHVVFLKPEVMDGEKVIARRYKNSTENNFPITKDDLEEYIELRFELLKPPSPQPTETLLK